MAVAALRCDCISAPPCLDFNVSFLKLHVQFFCGHLMALAISKPSLLLLCLPRVAISEQARLVLRGKQLKGMG